MSKKKALVLGYFGYQTNQLDGQTVKTRNIYTLLKSKENSYFKEVFFFDTQSLKKSKINLLKCLRGVLKSDILYYLPARKNLKYIFPFIFILCKISGIRIHYILVGGWLAEYLINKPIHRWMLARVDCIYPQNRDLTISLRRLYGFNNVTQLNNFRIVEELSQRRIASNNIKLVFMARVKMKKGVKTLFKIGEIIKQQNIKNIQFDIYGPIESSFNDSFESLLNSQNLIEYKGVLHPNSIHRTLCQYDLMLFPTEYYTEGFPGSILDAYISDLPVIVSDWKYSKEFVDDGVSGLICEFKNEKDFVEKTINLIKNPILLRQLKMGASIQKEKYSSEKAWEIIKQNIKHK